MLKRKKPRIGRRAFLRGAGTVALGLPFLDALSRRGARAQDTQEPRYAVFIRQGNGVAQADNGEPERFWPRSRGALTTAGMLAEPDRGVVELADFADKLLLVSGVKYAFPGNGCGHSGGGNQCLTAARVSDDPSGNLSLALGESIDNRIARELSPDGAEPLTLMTGSTSGFLPVVLSYRGPRELRGPENDPFNAYVRMAGLAGADEAVIEAIRARRKSVNDLVREEMQELLSRSSLSTDDRRRLDLHFTSIRELEINMSCTLDEMRVMEMDDINPLTGSNYQEVTRMHMDLVTMAFACDYTRSATIQMGQGNDGTQFAIRGYRGGELLPRFHQISHRIFSDGSEGDPIDGAQEMHFEVDKLHARLFRYLLERLDGYMLPEGTLLDQTSACWLNDLGAGVSHTYENIPFVFAGSCGGALRTGAYIDARGETASGGRVTHNRLWNTVLTAVGVRNEDGSEVDDFGDASLTGGVISSMLA